MPLERVGLLLYCYTQLFVATRSVLYPVNCDTRQLYACLCLPSNNDNHDAESLF